MGDIPAEKMFGQFPEQASKEGRLKGGFEVDPLIRNYLKTEHGGV